MAASSRSDTPPPVQASLKSGSTVPPYPREGALARRAWKSKFPEGLEAESSGSNTPPPGQLSWKTGGTDRPYPSEAGDARRTQKCKLRETPALAARAVAGVPGRMPGELPKSTSDDSHLAGDSEQSENKDFAGMAARVMGGTSDDTHLADDSKRQENAAGYSGSAPPVQAAEATEGTSDHTHLGDARSLYPVCTQP